MVFSIIIIIAIIAIAFYVISIVLSLGKCSEIGLFYDDLRDYIDKAWQSTIHADTFEGILPSGIDLVCFGNLTQSPSREYIEEYNEIKEFRRNSHNVFLYPPQEACDAKLSSIKLDNAKTSQFFCIPVEKNKIKLKTEKNEFESLVNLVQ